MPGGDVAARWCRGRRDRLRPAFRQKVGIHRVGTTARRIDRQLVARRKLGGVRIGARQKTRDLAFLAIDFLNHPARIRRHLLPQIELVVRRAHAVPDARLDVPTSHQSKATCLRQTRGDPARPCWELNKNMDIDSCFFSERFFSSRLDSQVRVHFEMASGNSNSSPRLEILAGIIRRQESLTAYYTDFIVRRRRKSNML